MAQSTDKQLKKYYSISEVAQIFNVTETLLRYWEKEFPNIQPRKCGRNIRQYSQEDIEEVRLVYNLVKVRGMRLSAARDTLRKNKEGVSNTTRLIERLMSIREELVALKKEVDRI